jgi:tetratricopeptide (TPR) repeat protein
VALSVLWSAAAAAREDDDRARELYQQGQTAFEAGRFAEAARAFEESYGLSRRPQLLWDTAQAYQRQYALDSDLRGIRRAKALYHNFSELAETPAERADGAREEQACDRILRDAERPVEKEKEKKPLYKQWWLWTAVGAGVAVVAVGVGLGVGLSQSGPPPPRTQGGNWMPFP